MDAFIEYWQTRTGLRPGGFPQPLAMLHRQYQKMAQTHGYEDILALRAFKGELISLYVIKRWKGTLCVYSRRPTLAPAQYQKWLTGATRRRQRAVKRHRRKATN